MKEAAIDRATHIEKRIMNPYELRNDFPAFSERHTERLKNGIGNPVIFLDNATTTLKPWSVIDTMVNYYERQCDNHPRHWLYKTDTIDHYNRTRKRVADFISAGNSHEIVLTSGAAEAIDIVATSYGEKFLKEGDEIILSETENPHNNLPWIRLAQRKNLSLHFVKMNSNGILDYDKFNLLINNKTKFIALSYVSEFYGTIHHIRGIISQAHSRSIPVLIDATHAVPRLITDVRELDCDFLVFDGHRMCGPEGIGILFGRQELLEIMDPQHLSDDVLGERIKKSSGSLPIKFETGSFNIVGALGMEAAVEYLMSYGMDKLTFYEQTLTSYALLKLNNVDGIHLLGEAPERSGIITFKFETVDARRVANFLKNEGILVSAGYLNKGRFNEDESINLIVRASLYFYNTVDEINLFIDRLIKAIRHLRRK
ncbi:aminotransferase class V-fold PLP-dependent enzyme [candidate division KSB1 bacterium]|nr:aminotransferase class V-fold PLP-dependent enzyme [candidate division KSB1 bacterium]